MATYRRAKASDVEGIASVLKECYNIETIEEAKTVYEKESAKDYCYIVCDESDKIAGITSFQVHGLPKHGLCELDRIAVLSKFRGKGIAKGLFDELITQAKEEYQKHGLKLRKLYILTHAGNKRAQSFYEKMGCRHETTLKDHYYDGTDEFVYSRFFS